METKSLKCGKEKEKSVRVEMKAGEGEESEPDTLRKGEVVINLGKRETVVIFAADLWMAGRKDRPLVTSR